jgi:NADH-quinone oxidoreductase subunit M
VLTVIGTLGIILTAVYVLRGVLSITFGPASERMQNMKDARLIEAIPMIMLVAFILLLGVYPSVLSQPLQQTIGSFDQVIQSVAGKIGG